MKTVIEMAREAGIHVYPEFEEAFERFAALVIANHPPQSYMTWQEGHEAGKQAEREHIAAWMIQRGYSTGHGDTTKDLLDELDWQVVQNWTSAMKTGVETEREACAKLVEQGLPIASSLSALDDMEMWGEKFAAAIRARGETK